jgi:macrolide-specific efflux system membrane fusion protein
MLQKKLHGVNFRSKAVKRLCIVIISSQLLTGCGLLPQEGESQIAPVLATYEADNSDFVYVDRGDIVLEKKIKCTYSQLSETDLSFPITGKTIDKVYFSAGESVKKGDLLAQLKIGDIDKDIDTANYSVGRFHLLLSQTKELMNLDIAKQQIISQGSDLSKKEASIASDSIKKQYEASIQSYEDSLHIAEMELASLNDKKETYRIYATMDGTLSFVKKNMEGSTSKKGDTVFTIIDSSSGAFRTETDDTSIFTEGNEITVTTESNSYQAVTSLSKEAGVVYFKLVTPDYELKFGDSGTIQLILDQSQDVLYLPSAIVHKMNNSYYVYYLDETGVQNMKPVEIGLIGDEKVEITSGLEYEEAVINR